MTRLTVAVCFPRWQQFLESVSVISRSTGSLCRSLIDHGRSAIKDRLIAQRETYNVPNGHFRVHIRG